MIQSLIQWLDHRTGIKDLLHEALYERVPGGARWRYVWGSTLVFTFSLQMITGLCLMTAYSASTQTAWESVYYIQNQMFLGNVVRGLHHFAAQAMVVLLAFHLIQVIIDGAYKAPREINFWLGLILMKIVLGLGLTGYLLPWDQKGYYATQVSTKIMGATPLVGPEVQTLAQGGEAYSHHTLTRFFAMHVGILPGLLVAFLALHIYVFRRHGLTVKEPKKGPDTMFWPDQVLKDAVACLGVLAVVMLLTLFKGAELSPPADPSEGYAAARPEWYFLFLFRFLKFEAVEHFGLAFGAIIVPGALMGVLFAMPLIARLKGGHKVNCAFTWVVMAGITLLTAMAFYEDGTDPDHQAAIAEASRDAHRIQELAGRPSMIPVDGALSVLRQDPFTQGPKLFAKHCSSCHRWDGHNGRGSLVRQVDDQDKSKKIVTRPEAVDLAKFASREWMKSVVVNYSSHFAALQNAAWYGKKDGDIDVLEGEMAGASKEYSEAFQKPENAKDLDALVEYLVAQTSRKDLKPDDALVARGQALMEGGDLADGSSFNSCTNCHDRIGRKFAVSEDEFSYPDLAGYGSAAWLKAFLTNPGSSQFYGEKNHMPAYAEKMTPAEMDLLIQWMTGDYYKTEVHEYPSRLSDIPAPQAAAEPAAQPAPAS